MLHKRIIVLPKSALEEILSEPESQTCQTAASPQDEWQQLLESLTTQLDEQREIIDSLKAQVQQLEAEKEQEEEPELPVTFVLQFRTNKDFVKAEPCLRSLSDLLEKENVDFDLIEM